MEVIRCSGSGQMGIGRHVFVFWIAVESPLSAVHVLVADPTLKVMCHSYPYLVMVNSVLPALIAGNAVILKPSPQTPLAAERFALAFHNAGVPKDALQVIHLSPELTSKAVKNPLVDFVAFTGSVAGGRAVDIAAAEAPGFKGVGLEVSTRALSQNAN